MKLVISFIASLHDRWNQNINAPAMRIIETENNYFNLYVKAWFFVCLDLWKKIKTIQLKDSPFVARI